MDQDNCLVERAHVEGRLNSQDESMRMKNNIASIER